MKHIEFSDSKDLKHIHHVIDRFNKVGISFGM